MSGRWPRAAELRLVPAALAAWLAAGLAIGADAAAPPVWAAVALWVGAALLAALAASPAIGRGAVGIRMPRIVALAAVAVVAAALVTSVASVRLGERSPSELRTAAEHRAAVTLEVTTDSAQVEGRIKATANRVQIDGDWYAVAAPVLIFGDRGAGRIAIGTPLRLTGGLEEAEAGDDVAFLVFPRGEVERIGKPGPLPAATDDLRVRLLRVARELPDPGGGLLPGLAIGETSAVDPALDSQMKASSLTHLTAVSGANCAIVVGLVWAGASALGLRRGVRVASSLAALVGFVVLVTPQASVLRAAVMAAVVLAALALGRPVRGVPVLCLGVLGLLIADPWLARDYGFALSVLATAGLLVLARPLADVFGRVLPRWLAVVVAVPAAAQLACQPVLLMLNPSLPLYGVPANLLAEPAAPAATVLGLIACLLLPVAPGLGAAIVAVAWVPAAWIAAVAGFFAGLPGAQSPWPVGAAGIILIVLVSAVALAAVVLRPGRLRHATRMIAGIAVVAYLASVAGIRIVDVVSRPPDWQFAQCDVGQGDAAVVRSGGEFALIDTGPVPARLAACLDELGVERIDLLVLTHYDLDHVGGVDAVVGRVDRVLVGPTADAADDAVRSVLAAGGARVEQVSRGERGTLGGLDWRVVWPPPSGVEPGNPASVTLLVTPGAECGACLSGVFLGDLGEESQLRLLGSRALGTVDVVKVAHHGSADQAAALYEAIRAPVGLIGVGIDNDYGHPTDSLLGILAATGTAAYRTDLDGLILVAPGKAPGELTVWTQR